MKKVSLTIILPGEVAGFVGKAYVDTLLRVERRWNSKWPRCVGRSVLHDSRGKICYSGEGAETEKERERERQ